MLPKLHASPLNLILHVKRPKAVQNGKVKGVANLTSAFPCLFQAFVISGKGFKLFKIKNYLNYVGFFL